MNRPAISAVMERRILVNYRVDPEILGAVVPLPFRPALVAGYGIAGICLIRLGRIRPRGLPDRLGLVSENAAHRIAVEWDTPDGPVTGVYVPRRDTSSRLSALAGGRVFPGAQHLARFEVSEERGRYTVHVASRDRRTTIRLAATDAAAIMAGSVFDDLGAASAFFRCAPQAFTPSRRPGRFDGMELCTAGWHIEPLRIETVQSSFFDDPGRFPPGSVTVDSAFLMAGVDTTWNPGSRLEATLAG